MDAEPAEMGRNRRRAARVIVAFFVVTEGEIHRAFGRESGRDNALTASRVPSTPLLSSIAPRPQMLSAVIAPLNGGCCHDRPGISRQGRRRDGPQE